MFGGEPITKDDSQHHRDSVQQKQGPGESGDAEGESTGWEFPAIGRGEHQHSQRCVKGGEHTGKVKCE